MTEDNDPSRRLDKTRGMTLGIQLAVGMVVFTLIGYKIDSVYGTLGGMFVGLFYGGYEVWKLIKETNDDG